MNRDRARVKLVRLYDKISNQRNDWQHKLSYWMAITHDVIILENLNIEGMKKFNTGIAKTVTLDFSWGEFTQILDYKMIQQGKHLVKVDRFYLSSKVCSNCGYKYDKLQLSDREWNCREWNCPECNVHHKRDVNASKTLRIEGIRILKEERGVTVIKSSTAGTTGSHAFGDRVRPVKMKAVVDEG